MANKGKGTRSRSRPVVAPKPKPKVSARASSVALAKQGVQSSEDFRDLTCAVMLDVIQGHMAPDVANAACNAGRNVLRMVELEYKFSAERSAVRKSMPISRRIANISA